MCSSDLADYRRDLNYNYSKKVDYVMWGETDSFFPKEAFQVIETLSEYTNQIGRASCRERV